MRRFLSAFLVLISLFSSVRVSAAKDIEIYLFGKEVKCDVAPVIENGRTLVPVRVISEEGLGADVKWNGEKKQVTITKGDFEVILVIGKNKATVNGKSKELDVPAKLISDRTMVPVRFISETFEYNVDWDNKNRRVIIEEKETPMIEKISLEETKNDNLLNVTMSSYTEPDIFTLKDPYRIVLDFKGYKFNGADESIDADTPFVKNVRYAVNDGFYRIVVECEGKQPYEYVQTGENDFSLIIGTPDTKVDKEKDDDDDKDDEKDDDKDKDKNDREDSDDEDEERDTPKKPASIDEVVVVIDAGHGGKDSGALGRDEEGEIIYDEDGEIYIQEKDINLIVAKKVYECLKEEGINVVLTRSKDVFLELRDIADKANDEEATVFVSIHCNSVDGISTAEGVEVLYFDKESDADYGISSKKLADNILEEIVDSVDTVDRGLKERPGLAVLKWTEMPAALVELGFVTSANDQERLLNKKWREKTAEAISDGIIKSLKQLLKSAK